MGEKKDGFNNQSRYDFDAKRKQMAADLMRRHRQVTGYNDLTGPSSLTTGVIGIFQVIRAIPDFFAHPITTGTLDKAIEESGFYDNPYPRGTLGRAFYFLEKSITDENKPNPKLYPVITSWTDSGPL